MAGTKPRVGERRPGGRATRVRADVLRSAAELLDESRLRQDECRSRRGQSRCSQDHRVPALATDAVTANSADAVPVPDTGSLEGDFQELARRVAANIGSEVGGRRSRSIVAAASSSDDLAAAMHGFWADRLDQTGQVVERAVGRGELDAGTDPKRIVETLIGPLWVRLSLTGEPITKDLADEIATLVTADATGR